MVDRIRTGNHYINKLGRPSGIEPLTAEPQSAVLPLNYGRHESNKNELGNGNFGKGILNSQYHYFFYFDLYGVQLVIAYL